jgi:hypothetical protein
VVPPPSLTAVLFNDADNCQDDGTILRGQPTGSRHNAVFVASDVEDLSHGTALGGGKKVRDAVRYRAEWSSSVTTLNALPGLLRRRAPL